jgi:hypothetical protein
MLTLWVYREPLKNGKYAIKLCPRPDGSPPPQDDAVKIAEGLSAEEYEEVHETIAVDCAEEYGLEVQHIRPSLIVIATLHAELRWTKKQRNADLRKWGYDPDSEDGKKYRTLFERACEKIRNEKFAEKIKNMPQKSIMVLWCPPADEHGLAQVADLITPDMGRAEYMYGLVQLEQQMKSAGITVVRLETTVGEVLDALAENNLPNNPNGRSAVFAILWSKKND